MYFNAIESDFCIECGTVYMELCVYVFNGKRIRIYRAMQEYLLL